MPKYLPSALRTIVASDTQKPVIVVELYLDLATLYFVAEKKNIVWNSITYTAKAINFGSVSQSMEGQINGITISFDNVSSDMAAYLNVEDFYGKHIIIRRLYRNALGSADNYVELFNGYCDEVQEVSKHWLTVPATTGQSLERKTLLKAYSSTCNRKFGDAVCNQDSFANLTGGTLNKNDKAVESGSTNYITDSITLTQPDDYWNYGEVAFWVKASGVTYRRKIVDFNASLDKIILDVPMTFSIDNTYTYNIAKGCPKDWQACGSGSTSPWGPSGNNRKNFFGFMHISQSVERIV